MTEYTISRRSVLAGLGTIGIASAGAGLGTTAFFSDEEQVSASLQAGRIDLKLDYRATYLPWNRATEFDSIGIIPGTDLDGDGEDDRYVLAEVPNPRYSADEAAERDDVEEGDLYTEDDWGELTKAIGCGDDESLGLVDGEEGVMFTLDDVKPKDEGEFTLSLHSCDNPAYMWLKAASTDDSENVVYEPEDSNGDAGESAGELDDFVYVEAWYDTNCNNLRDGGQGVSAVFVSDRSGSMTPARQTAQAQGLRNLLDVFNPDGATDDLGDNYLGLVSYGDRPLVAERRTNLTNSESDFEAAIADLEAADYTGGTGAYYGLDAARQLYVEADPAVADTDKYVVLFTDGRFNDEPSASDDDGFEGAARSPEAGATEIDRARNTVLAAIDDLRAAVPDVTLVTVGIGSAIESADDQQFLADIADENAAGENLFFADVEDLERLITEVARTLLPDILLYRGSLAGFLNAADGGIALNPLQTENFQVDATGDDATCVDPGVTCIAVNWYLPCYNEQTAEVWETSGRGFSQLPSSRPGLDDQDGDGVLTLADELVQFGGFDASDLDNDGLINVVQTDSAGFRFDVAAVQCRHNMDNANPFGPEPVPSDE
jgi:predicted ribosomally synthesized peptide with SipW-like signal peptide